MSHRSVPLHTLPIGQKARVAVLTSDAATRRRMLDLGIVNGTDIKPLFSSPAGDPIAYLIRGAVIALRKDAAKDILVSSQ